MLLLLLLLLLLQLLVPRSKRGMPCTVALRRLALLLLLLLLLLLAVRDGCIAGATRLVARRGPIGCELRPLLVLVLPSAACSSLCRRPRALARKDASLVPGDEGLRRQWAFEIDACPWVVEFDALAPDALPNEDDEEEDTARLAGVKPALTALLVLEVFTGLVAWMAPVTSAECCRCHRRPVWPSSP